MQISHSSGVSGVERQGKIAEAIGSVSKTYLREVVERIAIPRHAVAEVGNNGVVREWINDELGAFGYASEVVGKYENVVARSPAGSAAQPSTQALKTILVGAHYDSVPGTPGADDNASAVAAMLGCARVVAEFAPGLPVLFGAFNREEDGFIGSRDFVEHFGGGVAEAHILEMVGYADDRPGSQVMPPGLPQISDVGNFLGLLGNQASEGRVDGCVRTAKTYLPGFPVIGLELEEVMEHFMPDLLRSDHVPFWAKRIPALMWTDTADFRNPNYHRPSDTPDTLNYEFLLHVTQLLVATVMSF